MSLCLPMALPVKNAPMSQALVVTRDVEQEPGGVFLAQGEEEAEHDAEVHEGEHGAAERGQGARGVARTRDIEHGEDEDRDRVAERAGALRAGADRGHARERGEGDDKCVGADVLGVEEQ